jgi:hypothetical protein
MSALISVSLDVSKIDKSKIKDGKYLELTISVDDETNQWGKNTSVYHSQTKEERESKASRAYIGGGKVVWTNGSVKVAEKAQEMPKTAPKQMDDDFPF